MKPNNFPLRPNLNGSEEIYTQTGGVSQKFTLEEAKKYSNAIEVTYTELKNLISASELVAGSHYIITDFKTCYNRPDYDKYRNLIAVSNDSYAQGNKIEPIIVMATSENTLAIDAYQPAYPNDKIKYDISYRGTESGNPAFGRIIERIDEFGNRTDYDHAVITFKRYRLITYNKLNPLAGNIDLGSNGEVIGTDTVFTNLSTGDVIAISNSNETFYKIVTITDDTTMTVTGETITATGSSGNLFYSASLNSYDSYYPNNVDGQNDFQLYNTFEAVLNGDGCINTYIGDHSKYFINGYSGDFLLANNVFKDGSYQNNTIGDSSYNNTFNDDCTSNKIGFGFRNNITDDDIDGNVIGDFCQDNIITANLQYNQIGRNFENNIILCDSFYRNRIGNDFRDNWLDGDNGFDFQNNQIGNQFNNNEIYRQFYKNVILNGYNNNQIWDEFYGNKVGNGFNDNEIYNRFYDNQILDYFDNNTIGDSLNIGGNNFYNNIAGNNFKGNTVSGSFYNNKIGNDFVSNNTEDGFRDNVIGNNFFSNNISYNFGYNTIGFGFSGNNIANDFGYGGGFARGNTIGNEVYNNTIGEYFYDNVVSDRFQTNSIGDYCTNNKFDGYFYENTIGVDFKNNDIKVYGLNGTDFKAAQGNIDSIINNTPNGIDNTYSGLSSDESNSVYGSGATFDVTVSGGVVTSVLIVNRGTLYQVGDQLVIYGSQFGGTDGVDDLIINVTGLLTYPYVYKQLNCTIFTDEADFIKLAFIDGVGALQVTEITPP
jgi:hypothetical protein